MQRQSCSWRGMCDCKTVELQESQDNTRGPRRCFNRLSCGIGEQMCRVWVFRMWRAQGQVGTPTEFGQKRSIFHHHSVTVWDWLLLQSCLIFMLGEVWALTLGQHGITYLMSEGLLHFFENLQQWKNWDVFFFYFPPYIFLAKKWNSLKPKQKKYRVY